MNSYPKIIIALVIFTLFFWYLSNKIAALIERPIIEVYEPQISEFSDGEVHVKGKAERADSLRINGRLVLISQKGEFETDLLFPQGLNIINILAKDRNGKTYTKQIMLNVK